MKTVVWLLSVLATVTGGFGQGEAYFGTTPSKPVVNSYSGPTMAQNMAVGGLFYHTDLTAVPNYWNPFRNERFQLVATSHNSPNAAFLSVYSGATATIERTVPGQCMLLQLRAWPRVYRTPGEKWNTADPRWCFLSGFWDGASNSIEGNLGGRTLPGRSHLSGIVDSFSLCITPKPTSVPLSLLGTLALAALAFFRRY